MQDKTSDEHYDKACEHAETATDAAEAAVDKPLGSAYAQFLQKDAEIHAQLAIAHIGLSQLARERENEERKLKFVGKK